MPPKLVLDTNTVVSAFFWNGNEAALLQKIEQGKARAYITRQILNEIEDVIKRPKFNAAMKKAGLTPDQIMQKVVSLFHLVPASTPHARVCRDEKDDKFLDCAESAKAEYIVSGDTDLLSLKEYKGIRIVKTFTMLHIINQA